MVGSCWVVTLLVSFAVVFGLTAWLGELAAVGVGLGAAVGTVVGLADGLALGVVGALLDRSATCTTVCVSCLSSPRALSAAAVAEPATITPAAPMIAHVCRFNTRSP
ncbi:hypothetical protein GCM10009664_31400 [Kitasatospora gansuensis]